MNGDASIAATKIANAVSAERADRVAPRHRAFDECDPEREQASEERDVRDRLRMAAVEHRRPDDDGEEESPIRALLDQQLDREKRERQPDGDGDDRKVQPGDDERAEGERDRADGGRQFVVAPPAEADTSHVSAISSFIAASAVIA